MRRLLMILMALSVEPAWAADSLPSRPNIVFILADDIGYGDLGCYGASKVKTLHLDRLSHRGMRFTDAHTPSAVCTPTRYALLTGQYAWRHPAAARILSGAAPLCIDRGTETVASLLKRAGYATGVVGKWHLGLGEKEADYNGDIPRGPRDVGFDYSFIVPATGDRVPCVYVENQRVVDYDSQDPIRVSYGKPIGDEPTGANNADLLKIRPSHGHDNTIINGISRIGYMSGGKAARWRDEDMADRLTAKAVEFIEKHQRAPFFLYFATHDVHVPRVPHPRFKGQSDCGTRGDVIEELDWCVGQVLESLARLKLDNNTLVIFTSDNGGVMDDGYQDGSGNDTSGHLCNGALRGFKGGLYEGGSRVPFMARWTGRIPAGKTSGELVCLVDMLATFAAIVGQPFDSGAGPDSMNVLPALLAEKPDQLCRDHLVSHGGGGGLAIRKGSWKLIPASGKSGNQSPSASPELYDLASDLAEQHNRAVEQPSKVQELQTMLETIRQTGRSRELTDSP